MVVNSPTLFSDSRLIIQYLHQYYTAFSIIPDAIWLIDWLKYSKYHEFLSDYVMLINYQRQRL